MTINEIMKMKNYNTVLIEKCQDLLSSEKTE